MKKDILIRLEALRQQRGPYIDLWKQLADHLLGYRGAFLQNKPKRGVRRNNKILNNTPMLSARTLASGLMAGVTSPSRPWIHYVTSDPALMESSAVRTWLSDVEHIIGMIFARSNLYNGLHTLYLELGTFGTGAIGVYESFESVARAEAYTVGEFMLDTDEKGVVDTFYREYTLRVKQLLDQFGYKNLSRAVRNLVDRKHYDAEIPVIHVIEPNSDRKFNSPRSADMPFRSVYVEAAGDNDNRPLKISGFYEFPIMAPRWDVVPGDVYGGKCPGMDALGDAKTLQLAERRKYQAIDKLVSPPTMSGPNTRNLPEGGPRPGENYEVTDVNAGGIRPVYEMKPHTAELINDIATVERRVQRAFYEDLFLMLAQSDRREITAREVQERHEEKLLMLGPVLERLHNELLDPLNDRVFNMAARAGILPPAPPELEGADLRVEYISTLARAQRADAGMAVERMASFVGGLAQVFPESRHKFDALQAVDEYALANSTPPRVIRGDREVQERLAAEQKAMQQQQQMEQAQQMAEVAQKAGAVKEDSAIVKALGGLA